MHNIVHIWKQLKTTFYITGTVEAVLMPFERIQTLLADRMHHEKFQNTRQAFQYVYVNYGYRELFRGAVPVLWRNGPSNALFFIMREEAVEHLPQHVCINNNNQQIIILIASTRLCDE